MKSEAVLKTSHIKERLISDYIIFLIHEFLLTKKHTRSCRCTLIPHSFPEKYYHNFTSWTSADRNLQNVYSFLCFVCERWCMIVKDGKKLPLV